ncbi:uncharacterized protein LTR77_010991 [Saxophila tyrrhenica]|uniref:ABC transporter domain-containing protein n=1 Tax=Saxophila tyrrhenica TaxID=1690608 RepID=A0AAV9NUB7_9PEZI|nr:hypothetical protein LTR77_010991 [Saxophila tyrrhenica]
MSDVEADAGHSEQYFRNDEYDSFMWEDISVTVETRRPKQKKTILSDVSGIVKKGELLALMGPSGSGKSTLLNALAQRTPPNRSVTGISYINGCKVDEQLLRSRAAYVDQEDTLTGSLTVRETLEFAARISLPSSVDESERLMRVDTLLRRFGLMDLADNKIGTPIKKGISGGQKRRLSVASQLVTAPRILFLDEPTSSLDALTAWEVLYYLKQVAEKFNLIVILSMHQPSTRMFELCDKLLLLTEGGVAYNGPVRKLQLYFQDSGYEIPNDMTMAECAVHSINTDFVSEVQRHRQAVTKECWQKSVQLQNLRRELTEEKASGVIGFIALEDRWRSDTFAVLSALIHRSFIKSYRDVVAYGIRFAMYLGLAVLMGTVWLRLEPTQGNVQSFVNAIFFGGAFMSFMAVAYIPAFLEDHSVFLRERASGLYGAAPFVVANFIVGVPYLFLISLLFSLVVYWMSNFRPGAAAFFTWTMWLFLDLLAAESLVVLVSSLMPIFVVALAGTAFANGLWMCVGGFLVPPQTLNPFWRYLFHYIDYQSYVFQGMMINEFKSRNYTCPGTPDGGCDCIYGGNSGTECEMEGAAVLGTYGFSSTTADRSVWIMIAIIAGYRGFCYLALRMRAH